MKAITNRNNIEGIDCLRGVSALYVLIYHLPIFSFGAARSPGWLTPFVSGGGMGVLLFFIISAFTLSRSLESRAEDDDYPLLAYAIRRLFRIAPLFFVWLIIYLTRDPIFYHVNHSPLEVLSNFTFLFNFNPRGASGIVTGSWTIGVEMIFYVLLPPLLFIASDVGKTFALLVLSLLVRMIWHNYATGAFGESAAAHMLYAMSFLLHLPTFLVGVFTYRMIQAVGLPALTKYSLGYPLIATALVLLGTVLYQGPVCDSLDPYTVLALALAMLLGGVCINPTGLLVNRVFSFYGRISFSVYLCHIPLILMLGRTIGKVYKEGWPVEIAYTCALAIVMAAVTTVAFITFYLVERPGTRMGRRVIAQLAASEDLPLREGARA